MRLSTGLDRRWHKLASGDVVSSPCYVLIMRLNAHSESSALKWFHRRPPSSIVIVVFDQVRSARSMPR